MTSDALSTCCLLCSAKLGPLEGEIAVLDDAAGKPVDVLLCESCAMRASVNQVRAKLAAAQADVRGVPDLPPGSLIDSLRPGEADDFGDRACGLTREDVERIRNAGARVAQRIDALSDRFAGMGIAGGQGRTPASVYGDATALVVPAVAAAALLIYAGCRLVDTGSTILGAVCIATASPLLLGLAVSIVRRLRR